MLINDPLLSRQDHMDQNPRVLGNTWRCKPYRINSTFKEQLNLEALYCDTVGFSVPSITENTWFLIHAKNLVLAMNCCRNQV